jgi:hypothetical protein
MWLPFFLSLTSVTECSAVSKNEMTLNSMDVNQYSAKSYRRCLIDFLIEPHNDFQ